LGLIIVCGSEINKKTVFGLTHNNIVLEWLTDCLWFQKIFILF